MDVFEALDTTSRQQARRRTPGQPGARLDRSRPVEPGTSQKALRRHPDATGRARSSRRASGGANDQLWAVEINGRAVGVIALRHQEPGKVRIMHFCIDPLWQHTAVLAKLIGSVRDYCLDHGCTTVVVEAGTMPRWIERWLGNHGFQLIAP